jgi:D-alanyl-D-alanine-carboxypeptidase/D-alanyl-D-alanine-endopeptidase
LHVLVCALIAAAAPLTALSPESVQASLDAYTSGFRGAAVAATVIEQGKVRSYFSGRAGSDGSPPDDRTMFQIGSLTKTFTATLFADMIVSGAVRPNDPIGGDLPAGVTAPRFGQLPITFANLAEQNSGLPRLPANLSPANPDDPYADYTPELLGRFLSRFTLPRAPGTRFEYSNLGVGLLGDLLARCADIPFATLLQQRVLQPLAMDDTTFDPSAQQRRRLAPGFSAGGRPQPPWTFGELEAAGGLYSDLRDMTAYVQANLAAPDGALGRAMLLAQTPKADGPQAGVRVGYVWLINVATGNTFMNGEVGGYHAFIGFNRESSSGIVVLANVADPNVDALALHLYDPSAVPQPPSPGAEPAGASGVVDPAITATAKGWFAQLRAGIVDRSRLTPEFSAFLTPSLLAQIAGGLRTLGDASGWSYRGSQRQGDVTVYEYDIDLAGARHTFSIAIAADGKIAGSRLR